MKGSSEWGSVRKIRSLAQIMALLEAIDTAGEADQEETIRKSLVEQHIILERARLRGAQSSFRSLEIIRRSLHALAEDNLSFLARSGFVRMEKEYVALLPESRRLLRLWNKGSREQIRKEVLERILVSPYRTYMEFLLNLQRIGAVFELPTGGDKRTKTSGLRHVLQSAGFKTDIASFYTTRDLFYDFRLVNHVTNEKKRLETLFLTCKITRRAGRGFKKRVRAHGYHIYYDPMLAPSKFCNELVEGYKTMSRVWSKWVSLIQLRDAVTIRLGISDDCFDANLTRALIRGGCNSFKVDGSAGYRLRKRTYGAIVKSMKMPLTSGGRPIQYVTITRKQS